MKKVMVMGCPGAGKSTFSRKLRDKTGLPLYYLDMIYHLPDKTTVSREVFDEKLGDVLKNDTWIIDGNYQRTIEVRLAQSDTVFLFDLPTEQCVAGAKARIGTQREDMPWLETEFDVEFEQYIKSFACEQLPRIYELLEKYSEGREIIIFKSREQTEEYLEAL